jgi:hypothetical protein
MGGWDVKWVENVLLLPTSNLYLFVPGPGSLRWNTV